MAVVPARAQYFGRNTVRYHDFAFQVLETEHFDVYYYPSEESGARIAARMAERWHARLERVLQHSLQGRQPLVLYGSHTDFAQTNLVGDISEGTGGVTESVRRRIILPLAGPLADTDHVLGHELVHAFQFDMTSQPEGGPGNAGALRLPLWFIEGMAEYLSIGPVDANTAMWLRDAARQETLPTVKDLGNAKYFPYRWGQAFWAYVAGRWGDDVLPRMLRAAAGSGNPNSAIEQVLGLSPTVLTADWHAAITEATAPVLAATRGQAPGRVVVRGREFGAEINVGPALSPDGRLLAFLSERSFFSMDLYVAEVATGRIVRRLTRTATDPHYSSVQFIYSAGAWNPSSTQVAAATVTGGHPALAVFDATSGARIREVKVPEVDEIVNPTWAPDGRAIAFTGMVQGLTDLFVYDLDAGRLTRLTNDPFADVQPAWSPDGARLVFATDRFTTNLDRIAIGSLRLAVLDPASGAIRPVAAFERGKHISPQWSPDGGAIYFLSDRDGITNLYRVPVEGGTPVRLTSVATGLSGITALSPALSVAARTGHVAVTTYDRGKYDISVLGPGDQAAGDLPVLPVPAAALPPLDRRSTEVASLLANAEYGLPPRPQEAAVQYSPRLSLVGVSQPAVGVGVSSFGTSIGGAISLAFADMLEDHRLGVAAQVTSWGGSTTAKDFGGQAVYVNQTRRLNWGVLGAQIPYLSGAYATSTLGTRGDDVIETDQIVLLRQTEQSAAGLLAYPLDRSRRVEVQGGVSRLSFDQIVTTQSYSLLTGAIYDTSTRTSATGTPLTLGTSSVAYVFDTSATGATSPIAGQRYRLEASPVVGTIRFTGLLADYRRYVMPVSFYTIAVRAMHYGRYGSGGEDSRLYPVYLGYPGFVRGYEAASIDTSECLAITTSTCPLFDRLLGSRVLVGNVELRFPLLRPFGASRSMYGPVPIEVGLFTDAGVAWSRGQKPSVLGGARNGVTSAGVAFRVNLFGFAVAEFDAVRPFERPRKGWTFAFNFLPGW